MPSRVEKAGMGPERRLLTREMERRPERDLRGSRLRLEPDESRLPRRRPRDEAFVPEDGAQSWGLGVAGSEKVCVGRTVGEGSVVWEIRMDLSAERDRGLQGFGCCRRSRIRGRRRGGGGGK
ncbi:uncharacterized protein A4U43_C03F13230 [Asparagus officinalis]|uniref:Uncharacterized protein n=1 Tax=Asparagus officinalis TaxID=4686 RepID=A0A5P1FA95_ASPOF|nr:uncharacterized protein A4U43_C03F13230 [Asparagus officinalis]